MLRNKHVVHDENSWAQAIPGAIVAGPGKDYNIEKIVCLGMYGDTLDQGSWNILHMLTKKALDWVTKQFDSLCDSLTEELEQEDRDDLLKRDSARHTVRHHPKAPFFDHVTRVIACEAFGGSAHFLVGDVRESVA